MRARSGPLTLEEAQALPYWRRPIFLLFLMAAGMPIAFNIWSALLNNFVIERVGFTGVEIGWLHTVREIPGFLSIGVILLVLFIREQVLGAIALALLGVATALTAQFPSFGGLLYMTLLSSIGFHYYEAVNQSLQLQWIDKENAPKMLGWIASVNAAASLLAYGLLVVTWKAFHLSYDLVYGVAGLTTLAIALFCLLAYPQFKGPHRQHRHMVMRKRYWLYYLLQFIGGARRQIFVVFAAFMMVEHFKFSVDQVTLLYLANFVLNILAAPFMGRALARFGERNVMILEYVGLTLVFLAYGGIYWFGWGALVACGLYIVDQLFFALSFSLKTYLQKIADPQDIGPTTAVSFTINHIAAVFLPASLGYLWAYSPTTVFLLAAGMAALSVLISLLIPRHPVPGHETVFSRGQPLLAE